MKAIKFVSVLITVVAVALGIFGVFSDAADIEGMPTGWWVARNRNIADFWGNPIVYKRTDALNYNLYSTGPNGKDEGGNGDDIKVSK